MNLFVIGDIHGCYNSFKSLLNYWDKDTDLLIQVGDIIDRGNHNPQTIKLCRELQKNHGAIFLKGNHELMAIRHYEGVEIEKWYNKFGKSVYWQYEMEERDLKGDLNWIKELPTNWENEHVFVSHAGISHSLFCMDENHAEGLLWNKGVIKKLTKTQVIGHTPHKNRKPLFMEESNCWNVDTGAYLGNNLSAIKLSEKGELIDMFSVKTLSADID